MSPGNMCHGGTNYLTKKYVGPTLSLGIVVGERIPSERSPANIPQRQVARERYPQRQVARETPKMSLGIAVNVVVNGERSCQTSRGIEKKWCHVSKMVFGSRIAMAPEFSGIESRGSSSDPIMRRRYIYRAREEAEERLIDDYFGDDEYEPKYPEETFRRRPIPEYFLILAHGFDCDRSVRVFDPILKCTSAIPNWRTTLQPDALDAYLQIAERTSRECLDNFTKCIHVLYNHKFLRRPSATDIEKTYKLHEEKHGLPGMLGSIDCMHWDWKNCPKSLHGQFKRRDHKYPTLMLEAVADQRLWIWHAYFGVPGANNDLNVLYGSPLFDDEIADIAPECPFIVNGHTYRKCYYLADGIYPEWSTFVKTFSVTRDAKTFKFKTVQEAARKDIERAFGVLQGRWGIIRQPARAMQINNLKRIMYCCIILHNMILENEGFEVNLNHMFVSPEPNMVRSWVERCDLHVRKAKELRDRKTHIDLRQDLVEHLWNNQ
ncbi:ALP1-like protein [Tanacetum coccineum]